MLNAQKFKLFLRKLGLFLLYLLGFIVILIVFHKSILGFIGRQLISEDQPEVADAIFVLSGSPIDRAYKAASLFNKGFAPYVVTTGSAIPQLFSVINLRINESELSEIVLKRTGIPHNKILVYPFGTSTRQEYERIKRVCVEKKWKKIIVVSDKFHTRRIRYTFKKKLSEANIECFIVGAPSLRYLESVWWKSEGGLLMVNNEYIKLMYYWLRENFGSDENIK